MKRYFFFVVIASDRRERGNPEMFAPAPSLDCFASLAMTQRRGNGRFEEGFLA
jgi:hypothetical protein